MILFTSLLYAISLFKNATKTAVFGHDTRIQVYPHEHKDIFPHSYSFGALIWNASFIIRCISRGNEIDLDI